MYVWSHTHHYYYHLEVKQEVVEGEVKNTHTHTHTTHTPGPPRYSKLAKAGNNICNVGGLFDFEKRPPRG